MTTEVATHLGSLALAEFGVGLRYDDLPDDVRQLARQVLLDTVGVTLAGSNTAEAVAMQRGLRELDGGLGDTAIWGTTQQTGLAQAALANGVAAHTRELDDFGGCAHTGAIVIPAALSVAARAHADGRTLLTALVVGYDVARRVMDAGGGYLAFKQRGWHSTGTCGGFGAAAAVAYILGLSVEQTVSALGLAASSAAGTWAFIHDGVMSKRLHAGLAAQAGVTAAYLARSGVTGPARIFESDWGGFYSTYVGTADPGALTKGLGTDFRIRLVGFKPYGACRGTHSGIEAALNLRERLRLRPEHVDHVVVRGSTIHMKQLANQEPRTMLAAQMSLPYSIATALVAGSAMLDQFTDEARERPEVRALARRVTVVLDPTVADGAEPILEAHLTTGETVTERVLVAKGASARRLAEAELHEKFHATAGLVLNGRRVAELEAQLLTVADTRDVAELVAQLRP